MRIIFLFVCCVFSVSVYGTAPDATAGGLPVAVSVGQKSVEAQHVMPIEEQTEEPNNTSNCKLFAWWWYVTPDMFKDDRKYQFLIRDAQLAKCDMGEFCATCGPITCTLDEKYYACRNLCDNRPSKPRFLSMCHAVGKVPHELLYFLQKKAKNCANSTRYFKKYEADKITWEKPFFYPQINKKINIGWNGDDDQGLAQGVPFPLDSPQVSKSGGVLQGTPSPVSTMTDGKGYTRYKILDPNNPLAAETLKAQRDQYTGITGTLPTNGLTPTYK